MCACVKTGACEGGPRSPRHLSMKSCVYSYMLTLRSPSENSRVHTHFPRRFGCVLVLLPFFLSPSTSAKHLLRGRSHPGSGRRKVARGEMARWGEWRCGQVCAHTHVVCVKRPKWAHALRVSVSRGRTRPCTTPPGAQVQLGAQNPRPAGQPVLQKGIPGVLGPPVLTAHWKGGRGCPTDRRHGCRARGRVTGRVMSLSVLKSQWRGCPLTGAWTPTGCD